MPRFNDDMGMGDNFRSNTGRKGSTGRPKKKSLPRRSKNAYRGRNRDRETENRRSADFQAGRLYERDRMDGYREPPEEAGYDYGDPRDRRAVRSLRIGYRV